MPACHTETGWLLFASQQFKTAHRAAGYSGTESISPWPGVTYHRPRAPAPRAIPGQPHGFRGRASRKGAHTKLGLDVVREQHFPPLPGRGHGHRNEVGIDAQTGERTGLLSRVETGPAGGPWAETRKRACSSGSGSLPVGRWPQASPGNLSISHFQSLLRPLTVKR